MRPSTKDKNRDGSKEDKLATSLPQRGGKKGDVVCFCYKDPKCSSNQYPVTDMLPQRSGINHSIILQSQKNSKSETKEAHTQKARFQDNTSNREYKKALSGMQVSVEESPQQKNL